MNIYLLSELHPNNTHVGWSVSHGLEKILIETCDAVPIYPIENKSRNVFDSCQHRLFKSWFTIQNPPTLGPGPNLLIVVGLGVNFLLSMLAMRSLLDQFDVKVGYLLDGFDPASLDREAVNQLDHLFVMTAEIADEINAKLPLSASFLPLATDALRLGSGRSERSIDIISYGRTKADVHQKLQAYYNHSDSQRTYFHTTFSGAEVFSPQEHIMLMSKLLAQSKINICFEPSYIPRFRGYSPILLRWFEGWSCGCTIVGRRPFGKGVDALLDWENSTLELPEGCNDWIPFLEDLLDNKALLRKISQQNYQECLLRHDWRYRIRDLFQILDLPVPTALQQSIQLIQAKVERSSTSYAMS